MSVELSKELTLFENFGFELKRDSSISNRVERVLSDHFQSVLKIVEAWKGFSEKRSEELHFRDCLRALVLVTPSNKDDEIYLCKHQSEVLGLMKIVETDTALEIKALVANPFHFRLGAGSSLLNKAEQIARERGKKEICLASSETGKSFYFRHGYLVRAAVCFRYENGRYFDRKGLAVDIDDGDLFKKINE